MRTAAAVLTLSVAGLLTWMLVRRDDTFPPPVDVGPSRSTSAVASGPPVPVPFVAAAQLAKLPAATTDATITAAPRDLHRDEATTGAVAHNRHSVPVFDTPGGTAFARLPPEQLGNDTWLPVIGQQSGWVQVLLPSRPNGSVGWLDTGQLTLARSRHEIRVDLGAARLQLSRDGQQVGSWPVSVGTARTPTPAGRTFLLAAIRDPRQSFSPLILTLGTHSAALETYAGGPGTVGIHTWPAGQRSTRPASHGCIRVPGDALTTLAAVPLGSLVRIDTPDFAEGPLK